jgi:hypothetical protein
MRERQLGGVATGDLHGLDLLRGPRRG